MNLPCGVNWHNCWWKASWSTNCFGSSLFQAQLLHPTADQNQVHRTMWHKRILSLTKLVTPCSTKKHTDYVTKCMLLNDSYMQNTSLKADRHQIIQSSLLSHMNHITNDKSNNIHYPLRTHHVLYIYLNMTLPSQPAIFGKMPLHDVCNLENSYKATSHFSADECGRNSHLIFMWTRHLSMLLRVQSIKILKQTHTSASQCSIKDQHCT